MFHGWKIRQLAGKVRRWLRTVWLRLAPRRVHPEKTFCVLAWKHLQINPEGTAKLCCRAGGSVCDSSGQPLSLDTHSLTEIWHSPHMVEVRRKMVSGERLSECASCYAAEDRGFLSYRTNSNAKWLQHDGVTVAEALRLSRTGQYVPEESPVFFQLNLGNLCNLKCRMCSSSHSSQIEADPIHSEWAPRVRFNDSQRVRWSGETLVLRPGHFRDVTRPDGSVWSGGGVFLVPVGPLDQLVDLELKLTDPIKQRELSVIANGVTLYHGVPAVAGWPARFDLAGVVAGPRLEIRVEPVCRGAVVLSVVLSEATLRRSMSSARRAGFNNVVTTRFSEPGDWHMQDQVLFDEILQRADTLQELYFTGGEPLINKKFHAILAYLVDRGLAGRITLQLNSNITKVTDDLVEQLQHFQHVSFTLSIDGFGEVYEYIRYPAKWSIVAENAQVEDAEECRHPCHSRAYRVQRADADRAVPLLR